MSSLSLFSPDFGESVEAGQPLPSLGDFYNGGIRLYAEPGTRFVYNNHGPATLGQLVQDVTGEPLDRYFRGYIFEPLGMADSDLLRLEKVRRRLATGYEIHSRGVKAVADRDLVTAGAASIYSTPRDMSRYLAALLGGGSNEHGSVLKAGTLAMMFDVDGHLATTDLGCRLVLVREVFRPCSRPACPLRIAACSKLGRMADRLPSLQLHQR